MNKVKLHQPQVEHKLLQQFLILDLLIPTFFQLMLTFHFFQPLLKRSSVCISLSAALDHALEEDHIIDGNAALEL